MDARSKAEVEGYLYARSNPSDAAAYLAEDVDLRLATWIVAHAVMLGMSKVSVSRRHPALGAIFAAVDWAGSADGKRETETTRGSLNDARAALNQLSAVIDDPEGISDTELAVLVAAQRVAQMAINSNELMYDRSRRSADRIMKEAREKDEEYRSPMDLAFGSIDSLAFDARIDKRDITKAMVASLERYPHAVPPVPAMRSTTSADRDIPRGAA